MNNVMQTVFLALVIGALMLLIGRLSGMFEGAAKRVIGG